MSSIGGTGGPTGPGGGGPVGPTEGVGEVDGGGEVEGPDAAGPPDAATAAAEADALARLAADLDAGRITPEQAMAALIDESVAGLPPADQAELRRLMEDMIASDPYLGGLLGGG